MWNKKYAITFALSMFLFMSIVFLAHAQAQYKLLAPLPQGTPTIPANAQGFSLYASQMFWFLLSAAVILALVMLVIGGVEYVGSAGNVSLLGDAKGRIINALLGLLLALAAWLILNLINPDLVDFSITIKSLNLPVDIENVGPFIGGIPPVPPPPAPGPVPPLNPPPAP